MNKAYPLIAFLCLSLILPTGCSEGTSSDRVKPSPSVPTTPTSGFLSNETVPPQPTIIKTQHPTQTPPSEQPAPTATNITVDRNISFCPNTLLMLPDNPAYQGTIILHRRDPLVPNSLINLETGKYTDLPENWDDWDYDFSPDGRWLAQHSVRADQGGSNANSIQVLTADGVLKKTIAWREDWIGWGWWDNNHLEILRRLPNNPFVYSSIFINPLTDQEKELLPNFPEIYQLAPPLPYGTAVYDPSLKLVVYPRMGTDRKEFVLWDLRDSRPITTLPTIDFILSEPRWAPGGDQFVVPIIDNETDNFFRVSRDGHIEQITDLARYYPGVVFRIRQFRWSPDGRFIAFWLAISSGDKWDERLAILDLDNQGVVDYCISGFGTGGGSAPPIWSPSSKQLVVESLDKQNDITQTVLLDIEHGAVIRIGENVGPIAWVPSVPKQWITTKLP